jgi:hypothetical protein
VVVFGSGTQRGGLPVFDGGQLLGPALTPAHSHRAHMLVVNCQRTGGTACRSE